MSDIQRLIIGYVPKGCSSDYIIPGDPEGSETKEEIIDLENQKFFNIKKDLEINISSQDLWDPTAEIWENFVSTFCNKLSNGQSALQSKKLGQLWGYFHEEGDLPDNTINIPFSLSTGGDIENKSEYCDGQHWYILFYNVDIVDDDEEIYDEKLILIHA